MDEWDIYQTNEVAAWLQELQDTDPKTAGLVDDAIYALSSSGPTLGRPLVDTIPGSTIANLKELRPGSRGRSEIRILFVFDPWRSAILLTAGDKTGQWQAWYEREIPHAEEVVRGLFEGTGRGGKPVRSFTKWDQDVHHRHCCSHTRGSRTSG